MPTPTPDTTNYLHHPHPIGHLFPRATTPDDRNRYTLSDSQLHFFHDHGYMAPLPLLNNTQLNELRTRLEKIIRHDFPRADELITSPRIKPGDAPSMIYFQNAWLVDEAFHDLIFTPQLTVPLCQLLGTDSVRFFHDQCFYKPARHGGIVAWHQDYSYWTRTTPAGHITAFLCLDDATPENGCLHVIPGSHKWSLLPKVDLMGKKEDMDSIKSVLTNEQLAAFHPTPIHLKAGECSLHHCLTLHGSHPNTSNRPRRSIVLNYMKPDTKSASTQPLMPNAPVIPPGTIIDGPHFPIAGHR